MRKDKKSFVSPLWIVLLMLIISLSSTSIVGVAKESKEEIEITASYRHPVSGVIGDSGGEASYVTGQGMVEGAVGTNGILEQTEDGSYYLTFTMSLIDFSTDHVFEVQESLEQPWNEVEAQVVGKGSDENGTTKDYKIKVVGKTSIIRCNMYVQPMGRDVTFFITVGNYIEKNELQETELEQGVTFSTDSKNENGDLESEEKRKDNSIDINQILYIIIGFLICMIIGVLLWNYKIQRRKKQQDQLWESNNE